MKERLTIRKLKCLTTRELQAFRRYVLTFKNREIYSKFCQVILDAIAEPAEDKPVPLEEIARRFKLSDARVNSLLNEMHVHFKAFVSRELWTTETRRRIEDGIKEMAFYIERHLDEFYLSTHLKIDKELENYGLKDEFYFRSKLAIAQLDCIFKPVAENLQKSSDRLDIYYISSKLLQGAVMLNHSNIHSHHFKYHLMQQVVEHLEKEPYKDAPTLYLWKYAYSLLLEPEDRENYERLEKCLYEQFETLLKTDARSVFVILSNSLRKLETDENLYYQKIFQYYTFQMEHDLLLVEGIFPPRLFDNIVTIALRVQGPEWTVNFIHDNVHKLEQRIRKVENGYNIARCHFSSGRFNDCLLELKKIEKLKFKDIHLNLARRRLKIQAYFEIEHQDSEYSTSQPERDISSFKKFLHQNKDHLSPEHERANLDFARFVNRLAEANNQRKIVKLNEEIIATHLLPGKAWLLQKLGANSTSIL